MARSCSRRRQRGRLARRPSERHLDVAAAKPVVLRDINLALDPASMLAVEDQRPGGIEAALRDATGAVVGVL